MSNQALDDGRRMLVGPAEARRLRAETLPKPVRFKVVLRAGLRARLTVTKTSTPTEQHQKLLAAIGAPLPERHGAV